MFKQKITILNSAIMLVILSMPVLSVKYDKLTTNAQYTRAVKFLEKESYKKAEKALKAYTKSTPEDTDGWNLYAFTNRKLGNYDKAENYYQKALELDPNNKSALEYQGELFVELGRLDEANSNLEKLRLLCKDDCLEFQMLERYINSESEKLYKK